MNTFTNFLKRHSLIFGILLMFLLTWPLDLANTGIVKINLPFALLLFLGWGFGVASFLMTWLTLGKKEAIALIKRYLKWRVGWKWYLPALLLEPLLIILSVYANALIKGVAPDFTQVMAQNIFGDRAALWLFFLPFFLTDLISNGEEIGWRGYVLPRLQAKFNALTSTLILGGIWGFWHLIKFIPHWNTAMFVFLIIHTMVFAVSLTWLYNSTKGSLLLVAIMHTSANATGMFFPIANTASNENIGTYIGYVLLEVVAAVVIVFLAGPARLSKKESIQVQA